MDLINGYVSDSEPTCQPETLDSTCVLDSVPMDILSTNDILFTNEILSSDTEISVPEFPQKININHDEELPSLDDLPDVTDVPLDACNSETLEKIMGDIEAAVNFDSFDASMYALNNPEFLMDRIQSAFDVFRGKVGRNMTYSEMRYMMG